MGYWTNITIVVESPKRISDLHNTSLPIPLIIHGKGDKRHLSFFVNVVTNCHFGWTVSAICLYCYNIAIIPISIIDLGYFAIPWEKKIFSFHNVIKNRIYSDIGWQINNADRNEFQFYRSGNIVILKIKFVIFWGILNLG